jgi:hypothetical protein
MAIGDGSHHSGNRCFSGLTQQGIDGWCSQLHAL